MVMKFHFKLISETQNKGSLPQSCQSPSKTSEISPGHSEGWLVQRKVPITSSHEQISESTESTGRAGLRGFDQGTVIMGAERVVLRGSG